MGWFVLRAGPAAAPLQLSFRPAGGAIIGRQKGVTFESRLTIESVEILASEAGMTMPARDPKAQEKYDRRSR